MSTFEAEKTVDLLFDSCDGGMDGVEIIRRGRKCLGRTRALFVLGVDVGNTEAKGTALVEVASDTDGKHKLRRHRRVDLVVEGFVLLFLWTFLFNFSYV